MRTTTSEGLRAAAGRCARTDRARAAIAAVLLGTAALGSGCSGGGSGSNGGPGDPPLSVPALAQFESCDDLRAAIVADARQKIEVQAEHLRADGWTFAQDRDVFAGSPGEGPVPAPQPSDRTDTNTQVPGVDEADVVENDGTHLYLLHGSELLVLASWPPETTAIAARIDIEGNPVGMFVDAGRAAVISQVWDAGELGGHDGCAWIGDPLPGPRPLIGVGVDGIAPCAPSFTKITLLDLAGNAPRVVRELYVEGGYAAARRHDDRVRVVVQRAWGLPAEVPDPWTVIATPEPPQDPAELAARVDAWRAAAIAALEASTLEEWLPARRERVNGALVDTPPSCSAVSVPAPGLSEHGATSIVALRMSEDAGAIDEALVLGGASQVYANADTLVIAQPDWSWYDAGEANDRTALHVFELPAGEIATRYRASGFVPGTTLSQFSLDVAAGVIRVATTISPRDLGSPGASPVVNRLTTARVEGDGIAILGATPDLAAGERLFAARFLGDRAYLVTFLQVDPLFVIDLADPSQPTVLGEVELPGFSEYLHPLGTTHLLTIGRDAGPDGRTRGVALRIFDVADPASPRLAHTQLLPGDGWSPAAQDHLAFTYSAERGILAIPYSRYDGEYRSSLVVIGVDAASGFTPRGEIDHARFAFDGCPNEPEPKPSPEPVPGAQDLACPVLPEMRRGLLIEDYVYSLSTGGVLVNALGDLADPVAAVVLPAPVGIPPILTGVE